MRVVRSVDEFNRLALGSIVLAIGNFDGCHKGHTHLLNSLLEKAKKYKAVPVVVSFNPHPLVYFNESSVGLLDTHEEKLIKLEAHGVEVLLEIPFTPGVQSLSAKDFIKNFLLKITKISFILLGHDFALGSGKTPAKNLLLELIESDIAIGEMDAFFLEKKLVSSSLIRELVSIGEVDEANLYLENPFSISGDVIHGEGNGKKHLVATANIEVSKNKLTPANGVYFTTSYLGDRKYPSITNIGSRPTLGEENSLTIESHLLDFCESIYGEKLKVIFHKKCRDEQKFESLQDLKSEIKRNIESRRNFIC